jgi:AmmeMemoRadiSam system protein B
MLRQPVVSGRFYESEAAALKNDVRQYLSGAVRRDGAVACLSPHAGYLYSGL